MTSVNDIWALYSIPEIAPTEGEIFDLMQPSMFPDVADRGDNYCFVAVHSDAVDPVIFEQGEAEELDDTLARLGGLLLTERTGAIHLKRTLANSLSKYPVWRLWCDEYDTTENYDAMNIDYNKVFGTDADETISREALRVITRTNIKAFFGS